MVWMGWGFRREHNEEFSPVDGLCPFTVYGYAMWTADEKACRRESELA